MVLWLIGMMGSGKTTVGQAVAERLGVDFIDTDQLVTAVSQRSIPDLWEKEGEPAFRSLERQMIASAASAGPAVVATGGGASVDPDNAALMRASGRVVWLTAEPDTLDERIGRLGGRPILAVGEPRARLGAVLDERRDAYARAAHVQVPTDGRGLEDVIMEVMAQWHDS